MPLKRYHIMLTLALLIVVGLFASGFLIHPVVRYQTHRTARHFYEALTAGDYALAFEQLAYYDHYSDLAPSISKAMARELWIERLAALQEAEVYLVDMASLEIYFDDGYPVGKAYVTIMDHGTAVTAVQQIHFAERAGTWLVQNFSTNSDTSTESIAYIDQGLSGLITPVAEIP